MNLVAGYIMSCGGEWGLGVHTACLSWSLIMRLLYGGALERGQCVRRREGGTKVVLHWSYSKSD